MNLPSFIVLGGILGGLSDAIREAIQGLYEGAIVTFLKLCQFSTAISQSYGIMPEFVQVGGNWTLKPGIISPFIQVTSGFGAAFALVFLIVGMIDTYMQEKMSIETFAKPFLQYLATVVLLVNCENLVAFFWNYGVLFTNAMKNIPIEDLADAITVDFTGEAGIGTMIGLLLGGVVLMFICFLLGLVVKLCAYIANFSRMIEAGLRGIGFPIAIGLSVDSSLRQGAVRYIKKFLAVALQGGFFIAIAYIFSATSITVMQQHIDEFMVGDDAKVNAVIKSAKADFRWDEEKQQFVIDNLAELTGAELDLNLVYNVEMAVGSLLVAVITTILPLIGLALGAIVVLFKSGQICNDIVGA